MENRSRTILRITTPVKGLLQRFMYLGLIVAAFGLILLGKIDAMIIDKARIEITDSFVPILTALSRPVATVSRAVEGLVDLKNIRQENHYLKEQNRRLMRWQIVARKLEAENLSLQRLLSVVKDDDVSYVTARVIANKGGSFSNKLIVNSGKNDGVQKGHIVTGDRGVIGRVSQVSDSAARVILLTDINSRVPILIESSRTRAIMAGTNSARTKLIHLPQGARVVPSDRIITSGHGGAFPPGLAVGIVASVNESGIRVQPFTDFSKLEFVRIADFGLDRLEDIKPQEYKKVNKLGGKSVGK